MSNSNNQPADPGTAASNRLHPTDTSYHVLVSSFFSPFQVEYELIRTLSYPSLSLVNNYTTHGTHSQILGRAVKNEHLALMIYSTFFGGVYLATRGGPKTVKPTTVQQAKDSVLLKADST